MILRTKFGWRHNLRCWLLRSIVQMYKGYMFLFPYMSNPALEQQKLYRDIVKNLDTDKLSNKFPLSIFKNKRDSDQEVARKVDSCSILSRAHFLKKCFFQIQFNLLSPPLWNIYGSAIIHVLTKPKHEFFFKIKVYRFYHCNNQYY